MHIPTPQQRAGCTSKLESHETYSAEVGPGAVGEALRTQGPLPRIQDSPYDLLTFIMLHDSVQRLAVCPTRGAGVARALSRAKSLHAAVEGEPRSALFLLELLNTGSLQNLCLLLRPASCGTWPWYDVPQVHVLLPGVLSLALLCSFTDLAIPRLRVVTAGRAAAARPLTFLHCPGWRDVYNGRVHLSTSHPSELGGLESESRPSRGTYANWQSRSVPWVAGTRYAKVP